MFGFYVDVRIGLSGVSLLASCCGIWCLWIVVSCCLVRGVLLMGCLLNCFWVAWFVCYRRLGLWLGVWVLTFSCRVGLLVLVLSMSFGFVGFVVCVFGV